MDELEGYFLNAAPSEVSSKPGPPGFAPNDSGTTSTQPNTTILRKGVSSEAHGNSFPARLLGVPGGERQREQVEEVEVQVH